ncbi:RAxF-45 family protein [Kurthia huakuii]|nr:RAxF-45 family protein [Kurthia huakuii]MBM7698955.1 hypothetical protein [Kurthia huakuii]
MKNSAYMTSAQLDNALYFARVITFKFDANGIRMPFFNTQHQILT